MWFLSVALFAGVLDANATEVVWRTPPNDLDAAYVAGLAGAQGPPLGINDLRGAAAQWTARDDSAIAALTDTLVAVRPYEARLDGELVIMRDLTRPTHHITVLRDAADRDVLFSALAYQGFAVNRFFGDTLASDPAAEAYRVDVGGAVLESPWVDAVAVSPDHAITAYDVAEAPQRVAFAVTRQHVLEALPASVVPGDLPSGASLMVDGVERVADATGAIKVSPGRHFAHVQLEGHILQRFEWDLGPAEEVTVDVSLTDEAFYGWLRALRGDAPPPPPEALAPAIAELGGTVWVADVTDGALHVYAVGDGAPTRLDVRRPRDPAALHLTGATSLEFGWLSSANFAVDPVASDFNFKSVNATTLAVGQTVDADVAGFRLSAGADLLVTTGERHYAYYNGQHETRLRPSLFVAAGLPYVQAVVGYTFPFHPMLGLRGTLPMAAGLELTGTYRVGLPSRIDRVGPEYVVHPLYAAAIGLAYRFPQ